MLGERIRAHQYLCAQGGDDSQHSSPCRRRTWRSLAAAVTPTEGAAAEPDRALQMLSGPASGLAGDRVTIWRADAIDAKRRKRSAGQFVKRPPSRAT